MDYKWYTVINTTYWQGDQDSHLAYSARLLTKQMNKYISVMTTLRGIGMVM